MIQVIASFCVVLGLMFGVLFGLRYFQQKQWFSKLGFSPKKLEILESLPLDPKRRVVWIRHEDEAYLVLLGQGQDVVLKGPVPFICSDNARGNVHDINHDLIEVSS
ncbi:MAG: flagellar biosynthetic protein FliO [Pseudomonadota bacterium]